jgi:hypothetical protein
MAKTLRFPPPARAIGSEATSPAALSFLVCIARRQGVEHCADSRRSSRNVATGGNLVINTCQGNGFVDSKVHTFSEWTGIDEFQVRTPPMAMGI